MGRRTKARRAIPPALALQSQRRRRRAKAGIAVTVTRRRAGLEAGKRTAAVAKVAIEIARSGAGVAIVTRKTGTRVGAANQHMQHRPLSQHQQALALQCWPLRQLEAMELQPLEPATEPSSEQVLIV